MELFCYDPLFFIKTQFQFLHRFQQFTAFRMTSLSIDGVSWDMKSLSPAPAPCLPITTQSWLCTASPWKDQFWNFHAWLHLFLNYLFLTLHLPDFYLCKPQPTPLWPDCTEKCNQQKLYHWFPTSHRSYPKRTFSLHCLSNTFLQLIKRSFSIHTRA